jgi:hypothetical protein
MRSRWTALLFVLVLAGLTPRDGAAQNGPPQTQPRKAPTGGLGASYPNPMNPEAWFPFAIDCKEPGREYTVTLKIYNALAQEVAMPVAQKGVGRLLNKLKLPCGQYLAYWNGEYAGTKRKAASGVYTYILEIDGHSFPPRRLMVSK